MIDIPNDNHEVWKPVKGLEKYEVSSRGCIKNITNGSILSGSINNKGYRRFDLCIGGKRNVKSGHRMVADAFLSKAPGKHYVNHIDGDKCNNNVANLEWCTHKENMIHAYSILGREQSNARPCRCIETGIAYGSTAEAARIIGMAEPSISRCCNGKRNTAGGMHWLFS